MPLNPRKQKFVLLLLADPEQNATKAYIAAGYSAAGAKQGAARLLTNVDVQQEIAKSSSSALKKVSDELEMKAEDVIRGLVQLAKYDPRKLYHQDGTPKEIHELDDATAMAITGMDVTEVRQSKEDKSAKVRTFTKKIRFADRGQNLERLGRHFKLFTEKVEGDVRITKVIVPIDDKKPQPPVPTEPDFG